MDVRARRVSRFGRNQRIAIWTGVTVAGATFFGTIAVAIFGRGREELALWISFAGWFVPGFLVPVLGGGALAKRVETPPAGAP
jgi:hypothetical protein